VPRLRPRPRHIEAGAPTAQPTNVAYRLGRVAGIDAPTGVWLDCGCAGGGYTAALLSYGARRACGVEAEADRLYSAARQPDVAYACAVAEGLPFADAAFDGVLLNEVLEHVADEQSTLREIRRVLKPDGRFALMSPNRWFPFEGHGMLLAGRRFDFPIPLLPWLPMRLAQHVMFARNYWPGELAALVREAGFEIDACETVFPVFEAFPWMPKRIIPRYRRMIPLFERLPLVRWLGNSTLIMARKSVSSAPIRGESPNYAAIRAVAAVFDED
jgi:SAM-dependent methyltransferase